MCFILQRGGRLFREAVFTVKMLLVSFPTQYLCSGCTTVQQTQGKTSIKCMDLLWRDKHHSSKFVVLMMVVERCLSEISYSLVALKSLSYI